MSESTEESKTYLFINTQEPDENGNPKIERLKCVSPTHAWDTACHMGWWLIDAEYDN